MPDVTFKKFDEFDNHEGLFLYAAKGLGVTSWGMNVERLPANWDGYPEHDHAEDGQEEVYVVLEGDVRLEADGESWELTPGSMARVGPGQKRTVVPGEAGATMLVIGAVPGQAFEPKS